MRKQVEAWQGSELTDLTAKVVLYHEILGDEAEHVDYLEGQLHARGEMGIENCLAPQLHKGKEEKTSQPSSPGADSLQRDACVKFLLLPTALGELLLRRNDG